MVEGAPRQEVTSEGFTSRPIELFAIDTIREQRRRQHHHRDHAYREEMKHKYASKPQLYELWRVRQIELELEDTSSDRFVEQFRTLTTGGRVSEWIERAAALSVPYLPEEKRDMQRGIFELPEIAGSEGKGHLTLYYTDEPPMEIDLLSSPNLINDNPQLSWDISMKLTNIDRNETDSIDLSRRWEFDPEIGLPTPYFIMTLETRRGIRNELGVLLNRSENVLVLSPSSLEGGRLATMLDYLDKSLIELSRHAQ